VEEHKRIAREYLEQVWDRGDVSAIERLVAPDYRGQTRGAGQTVHEGKEALARWVGAIHALFDDRERTLRWLAADGARVCAEVVATGTHRASGRRVTNEQLFVLELRDGKIAAESIFFDVGGALAQLK
jgi:steroid delta-isomerase-like uncharacterized protein